MKLSVFEAVGAASELAWPSVENCSFVARGALALAGIEAIAGIEATNLRVGLFVPALEHTVLLAVIFLSVVPVYAVIRSFLKHRHADN